MRALFWFLMTVLLGVLILRVLGYEMHPDRLPRYFAFDAGGTVHEVTFHNGLVLEGKILEETPESIKLDAEGAVTVFEKSEIHTVKSVTGDGLIGNFMQNYRNQSGRYPLLSYNPDKALFKVAFDPGSFSGSQSVPLPSAAKTPAAGKSGVAMIAEVQALADKAKQRQAELEAEMRRQMEG